MSVKKFFAGKYIISGAVLVVLGGIIWHQCSRADFYNSGFRDIMGTYAQITVFAKSEKQAQDFIDAAFDEMYKLNRMMNDWDPNSEISQLTLTAYKSPVVISPELFEVIETSVQYSKLSNGAFDITVGPETQLWRQMQKTHEKPTQQALHKARAQVGYEKLALNPANRTIKFAVEGMKLDVGAIAKGYAVDRAFAALKEKGAVAGMVDLAGNVRCFGRGPQGGGRWLIGLQNPRKAEEIVCRIRLDDMSVATSGDYERYAVVEGRQYSHILNPKTFESVKELASVTIIAPTAMQSDALSTSISVLSREKGLELIEKIPGAEAILMTTEQPDKIIKTSGADKFIEKQDWSQK